jgi:hypothetical protein
VTNVDLTQGFAERYGAAKSAFRLRCCEGRRGQNCSRDADVPFYKFTSLGLRGHLGFYHRNRFSGDASLYFNSELRLSLVS